MQIKQKTLNAHEFTSSEWLTLCHSEAVLWEVFNSYDRQAVLQNPNNGDHVAMAEVLNAMRVLSFLTETPTVEVVSK